MGFLELFLIGVGLSMDAFAVAICQGLSITRIKWGHALTVGLYFGGFQALMPLIGWACASTFSHLIEDVDHWIAFAILAFLGGRMVRESFKEEDCRQNFDPTRLKVVLMLAVATSIDALAVGVSFAFLGMKSVTTILSPVGIIGFVSFALSLIGLTFGIRFGCGFARRLKAERWGGVILILIGLKILIEHLIQHYG